MILFKVFHDCHIPLFDQQVARHILLGLNQDLCWNNPANNQRSGSH